MTKCSPVFDLERAPEFSARTELISEVRRGLLTQPRSLAPWMFYDQAGSELFERITALPEYYLTRTESRILTDCAEAIIAEACPDNQRSLRIVELGAGTASKTGKLLEAALLKRVEVLYMPVDVSGDALDFACRSIDCSFPRVRTEPVFVNYVTNPLQLEAFDGPTLVLYLGSSIGNFSPLEARIILQNISRQLQTGDALVLGTDLVKDESTLAAAYDDGEGVTAAFNINILRRLNRELHADFDLKSFRHCARWNSAESRIEMHLQSTRDQTVVISDADVSVHFAEHETIHTENSYKFSSDSIKSLLQDSGFEIEKVWKDRCNWFALTLANPSGIKVHIRTSSAQEP